MEHSDAGIVLVAVDGSDNSRRAVEHVAQMLAHNVGVRFVLLHVVAEPDPDYFSSKQKLRDEWILTQRAEAGKYLEEYKQALLNAGIADGSVSVEIVEKQCPSLADCILEECANRGAGVLALGRQGRGAKEELLMGSVSKAAVHKSKGRAVWVVT